MANFEVIAELNDMAKARVLISALKAHGFNPLEGGENGLPGMPGIRGAKGVIPICVPEGEASDCRLLAGALLADMNE